MIHQTQGPGKGQAIRHKGQALAIISSYVSTKERPPYWPYTRARQSGITARFAFCKLYVSTKERPHIHDTSDTRARQGPGNQTQGPGIS